MSSYQRLWKRKSKNRKKEGIIQTLIKQLQSKLGFLSKDTLAKIESCNQEQLDSLTIHIFDIYSEKDILHYLSFD